MASALPITPRNDPDPDQQIRLIDAEIRFRDAETRRLRQLGIFVAAFAPAWGETQGHRNNVIDSNTSVELLTARHKAVVSAFAAIEAIAGNSAPFKL